MEPGSPVGEIRVREAGAHYHKVDLSHFFGWQGGNVFCPALKRLAHLRRIPSAVIYAGKREILLQADSSWNGKLYTQYPAGRPLLTMLKVTMNPNTALPWHTHPVPNAGYILSGDLTLHDRASGVTHTYHAGESFAESVNAEHRGEAGENGAVLLLTYAGTPGTPTSIPAHGEKPEY
jgi:quercetin dioxygenase-like cupin family protein